MMLRTHADGEQPAVGAQRRKTQQTVYRPACTSCMTFLPMLAKAVWPHSKCILLDVGPKWLMHSQSCLAHTGLQGTAESVHL